MNISTYKLPKLLHIYIYIYIYIFIYLYIYIYTPTFINILFHTFMREVIPITPDMFLSFLFYPRIKIIIVIDIIIFKFIKIFCKHKGIKIFLYSLHTY